MPIFFEKQLDEVTKLAIWKIEEEESFFGVPLQREIKHPHKRLQHLAGRFLLTYLFPQFPLALIRIADTRKPYLEDEAFHFSISHCSDYAAAIVSKTKRVGVDIEIPSARVAKIQNKFLHPDELAALNRVHPAAVNPQDDGRIRQLTLLWSAKEAIFKWWSFGGVDFSEMIRIDDGEALKQGTMQSRFLAPHQCYHLHLHYRFFDSLCLAWVTD